MKMNMIVVMLSGFSVVATLVIGILGCLLSRCKSKSSYDTVMGGKTDVEKEEYGLLVVDGGGETCNCNTGLNDLDYTGGFSDRSLSSSGYHRGDQGSHENRQYSSRKEAKEAVREAETTRRNKGADSRGREKQT